MLKQNNSLTHTNMNFKKLKIMKAQVNIKFNHKIYLSTNNTHIILCQIMFYKAIKVKKIQILKLKELICYFNRTKTEKIGQ